MRTARDFRRPDAKENVMLWHLVIFCCCATLVSLVVFWSMDFMK